MFKKIIKNIRQKPKAARDNIALGIAGVFTAMIAIVWIIDMPARYDKIEQKHANDESPSFFSLFTDFKDQLATAKESTAEAETPTSIRVIETENTHKEVSMDEWALPQAAGVSTSSTRSATSSDFTTSTTSVTESGEIDSNASGEISERPIRIITINKNSTTSTTTTAN